MAEKRVSVERRNRKMGRRAGANSAGVSKTGTNKAGVNKAGVSKAGANRTGMNKAGTSKTGTNSVATKRSAANQLTAAGKKPAISSTGRKMGNGDISNKESVEERRTKDKRLNTTTTSRSADKRKKNLCTVSRQRGDCQMLDMPYEQQLAVKQKQLETLLKGTCKVNPIIGMKNPCHYRNKVHAVFGHQEGEVISGVYKAETHILVPVETCMIEDERADETIGTIRDILKSFKIHTYDGGTGYGLLCHVLAERGFSTDGIMAVLVIVSPVLPSRDSFIKALREKHPEVTTIIQSINDRETGIVLGDKEETLYGKSYIEDILRDCTFRISSESFYQINLVQTEILYTKTIGAVGLTGERTVIGAYYGISIIGTIASQHAGEVIGVRLSEGAVRDAVENVKHNQIKDIQFYNNDADKFMVDMASQGEKIGVVFMDPLRNDSTEEFMDSVVPMKPDRVIYVFCNPETLVRDLECFKKKGYVARETWGVDLFPMTEHTECCVKLEREEK